MEVLVGKNIDKWRKWSSFQHAMFDYQRVVWLKQAVKDVKITTHVTDMKHKIMVWLLRNLFHLRIRDARPEVVILHHPDHVI